MAKQQEELRAQKRKEWLDRRDIIAQLLSALSISAQNYHASQTLNKRHEGRTWKKCNAYSCMEARSVYEKYSEYATPSNHNPYALANWHRNIRKMTSIDLENYLAG